jgi:phenylacetate-CoA ligase
MRGLRFTEKSISVTEATLLRQRARAYERLAASDAQTIVVRRLRRIVDSAYSTVPFFRDLYRRVGYEVGALRTLDDLHSLPIITKDDLLASSPESLVSRTVPKHRLLPSITSGTTGQVLTVWHDGARLGRIALSVARVAWLVAPYRPWDRTLYIYTSPFPVGSVGGLFPFRFVSTTEPTDEIVARWRRMRPAIVWIYPSRLRDLEETAARLPAPRLISVNSEYSSVAERTRWEKLFRAPVRDQYATEELGIVAAECEARQRHVFSDSCWVEIADSVGEPVAGGRLGRLVGTNLTNLASPIIRYDQGDKAGLVPSRCECGRTLPVLEPLEGRARLDFRTSRGEVVSSGVLVDALYGLIITLGLPIRAYQLEDGAPPELRLVADRELTDDEIRLATRHLQRTTGLDTICRVVETIPMSPGGKREALVPRQNPLARK